MPQVPLFFRCFSSEWLKLKRSPVRWLLLAGGLLVPLVLLIAGLVESERLAATITEPGYWLRHIHRSWQSMAIFLLPVGIVLTMSLLLQIEHTSNGWRQLHLLPVPSLTVFCSKLAVVLVLFVIFLALFTAGIGFSGVFPAWVLPSVPLPEAPFPLLRLLRYDGRFLVATLPIVALQFAMSLQFRNFLLPAGIGIGLVMASLIALPWKHAALLPYTYAALHFFSNREPTPYTPYLVWLQLGYTVLFLGIGYLLYRRKKIKD